MRDRRDTTDRRQRRSTALSRHPRLSVVLLTVLLAPLALAWFPGPDVRGAGPVIDLTRDLRGDPGLAGKMAGRGRFLLTTVREEHDAMWLWALRSVVDPGWRPGGRAAGPLNTLAQMRQAETAAWEVALAVDGSAPRPLPVVDTGGVTGPSGGLMLALAFTDGLHAGNLTAGRTVAGTGTIDASGNIGAVGFVAYKVRGAAAAGASVFFVPLANAAEAERAAPSRMRVVPVATFADALGWLCRRNAADAACRTAAAP